jgi:ParB family transcriptional regulator, chromosome partitioning protein
MKMNTTANKPRNHEAVVGRSDYYRVDPKQVVVIDGWNPRNGFDAVKLEELKESIKENGVLVPIRVKINNDGQMVLVDGERRLRATLTAIEEGAEILSIPAIVERKSMNEIDALILAMTANTGEPLTVVEEATAIKRLNNYGMKPDEIAKKLGKSIPTVYSRMKLLDASPEVLDSLENREITAGDVKKIVDESDTIEEQNTKKDQIKEKKANRKKSGQTKPNKKAFVDLCTELVEWLNEMNQTAKNDEVDELLNRAYELLDNDE